MGRPRTTWKFQVEQDNKQREQTRDCQTEHWRELIREDLWVGSKLGGSFKLSRIANKGSRLKDCQTEH